MSAISQRLTKQRRAWHDRFQLVHEMALALMTVHFDSFVVSGTSGLIVAPELARATGRPFDYVYKQGEATNNRDTIDTGPRRWIFVDDFISSGRTFLHVCRKIQAVQPMTTCVGVLQYAAEDRPFFTPIGRMWERRREWNLIFMQPQDIPGFRLALPHSLGEMARAMNLRNNSDQYDPEGA